MITANQLIQSYRKLRSQNQLLPNEEADLSLFKDNKILHTKADIVKVLNNHILLVKYQTVNKIGEVKISYILCTANMTLSQIFLQKLVNDKRKLANYNQIMIQPIVMNKIKIFDFISKHEKTLFVNKMQILPFALKIENKIENKLVLDQVLRKIVE